MKGKITMRKNGKTAKRMSFEKNISGWLLILPAVIAFAIFVWRPIVISFVDSLFRMQGMTRTEFIGLKNYTDVISDTNFMKSLWNTVKYVLWSLVLGLPLPFLAAVMMNEMVKTKQFFNVAFYLPCVIPSMATYLIWRMIYADGNGGLLNMLLYFLGIMPMSWLSNANLSIPLIVITMTWSGFGGAVILYLSSLQGIDQSLYEAARLDGAGIFTRVKVIMMPNIWGILLLQAVRQIISVFQVTEQPLVMTGGGPNGASASLGLVNYYYAFKYGQFDKSMALSVVIFLLLIWLTIVYFKLDKKIND